MSAPASPTPSPISTPDLQPDEINEQPLWVRSGADSQTAALGTTRPSESRIGTAPRAVASSLNTAAWAAVAPDPAETEIPGATTRRGGALVSVLRSTTATVCATLTVVLAAAAALVLGTWNTFVDTDNYMDAATAAYDSEKVPRLIADQIVQALWEQHPPQELAQQLGDALIDPDAAQNLPAEFEPFMWQFNDADTLQALVKEWVPPYIETLVKSPEGRKLWIQANEQVHENLLERFAGTASNRQNPSINLESFKQLWTGQTTGVLFVDQIISSLDLNVRFVDGKTMDTLGELYDTGKTYRILLPLLAIVAFAGGLLIARKRHWYLTVVGLGLLVTFAFRDQLTSFTQNLMGTGAVNDLGSEVLGALSRAVPHNVSATFALVGIAGGIVLAAGLAMLVLPRIMGRKVADS